MFNIIWRRERDHRISGKLLGHDVCWTQALVSLSYYEDRYPLGNMYQFQFEIVPVPTYE